MAVIIEPIIKNIRDTKVKIFLESKGIKESENDDRLELSAWPAICTLPFLFLSYLDC